jgi:hypothetical protein
LQYRHRQGGTWCTGGLFVDRWSVWPGSTNGPDQGRLPPWLKRASTIPHVDRTNNWTDRTVFHNRLLCDGWQLAADAPRETWQRQPAGQPLTLLLTGLGWDVRASGGPHLVEYALRGAEGDVVELPGVTWADWDQRGRLVMVQDGKLVHRQSGDTQVPLADFNAQIPESSVAPALALNWPRRPARHSSLSEPGDST